MNAPDGSEGTRDALPTASPVPERQATASVDRKSGRPAISWTGLFALFVLSGLTLLMQIIVILGLMATSDRIAKLELKVLSLEQQSQTQESTIQ